MPRPAGYGLHAPRQDSIRVIFFFASGTVLVIDVSATGITLVTIGAGLASTVPHRATRGAWPRPSRDSAIPAEAQSSRQRRR